MARIKQSTRDQRKEVFRTLLEQNKCEAEMRSVLNISQPTLDKLFADAGKQRWKELTEWNPTCDMVTADSLPSDLVNTIRKASGVTDESDCKMIKINGTDGGVVLACASPGVPF